MRLLAVHADDFTFEVHETTIPEGADIADISTAGGMADCLVLFVTVETGDEPEGVVESARSEIDAIATQLDTTDLVLFPSAHLSAAPASAELAQPIVEELESALAGSYELCSVPFELDTRFDLSSKGHPFARQSRQITTEGGESATVENWSLVTPDGSIDAIPDPAADSIASKSIPATRAVLQALQEAGFNGSISNSVEIRHPETTHSFLAYDDSTDSGALRLYPPGTFVRDSFLEYLTTVATEYGAMPVDRVVPADGDHRWESHNSAPILGELDLPNSAFPVRLYDRSTATPELQTVTTDIEMARAEVVTLVELVCRVFEMLGLDAEPVIRISGEFDEPTRGWVRETVAAIGQPTLLGTLGESGPATRIDFVITDSQGTPLATPRIRIDTQTAVQLTASGQASEPTNVVSCSPLGSLEQLIVALLERTAEKQRPRLPTWLSPTQTRLIPVESDHLEYCEELASELETDCRIDIDDRPLTVGERIVGTESDLVPYYAVVGDNELAGDQLAVTDRSTGRETGMTADELRDHLFNADPIQKQQYLPRHLTEQVESSIHRDS